MKRISIFLMIFILAMMGLGCDDSGDEPHARLNLSVRLPANFQQAFLFQSNDYTLTADTLSLIKYARITVEGEGINPPIVREIPFDSTMDVLVPAGSDRFFTVSLMDAEKNVLFEGSKLVPYLPAGEEVSVTMDLYFARSFTDSVRDFYPSAEESDGIFDLRNLSLMWGADPDGNQSIIFSMYFDEDIELYKGEGSEGLMGIIEIDADRNLDTGIPSIVDTLRPVSKGKIGVDYIIYIEGLSGSRALVVNVETGDVKSVPIKIIGSHLIVTVPADFFSDLQVDSESFFVDAAFVSYTGDNEFVDIFPDIGAAVSNDLASMFIGDDFFGNITRFAVKEVISVPDNLSLELYPFHFDELAGIVYTVGYSSSNTVSVGIRLADFLRNKTINRPIGVFSGSSYLFAQVAFSNGVLGVLVDGYNLNGCSDYGYALFVSFDRGFTFKGIDSGCTYNGSFIAMYDSTLLLAENSYSALITAERFQLYPDHVAKPESFVIDQSGLEYPVYFTLNDSLYQAGISVSTDNLASLMIYRIASRHLMYELPITRPASGYYSYVSVSRVVTHEDQFYLIVSVWDGSSSYEKILGFRVDENGLEKIYEKKLEGEVYVEDLWFYNDEMAFIMSEYKYVNNTYVSNLNFVYDDGRVVPIGEGSDGNSVSYLGKWLIPPATPIVFWLQEGSNNRNYMISMGVPQ